MSGNLLSVSTARMIICGHIGEGSSHLFNFLILF